MKPLLLILTLACLLPLRADDAAAPNGSNTEIAKFQSQTQTVIIKAYSVIGSITGKSSSKIEIRSLDYSTKSTKSYAIQISLVGNSVGVVDSDEIAPLLAGIDSLIKVDKTATKLDYFDASYMTRGGIQFVRPNNGYPNGGETQITIGIGDSGLSTFTIDEMIKIKALIQKAQAKLQSIQ